MHACMQAVSEVKKAKKRNTRTRTKVTNEMRSLSVSLADGVVGDGVRAWEPGGM